MNEDGERSTDKDAVWLEQFIHAGVSQDPRAAERYTGAGVVRRLRKIAKRLNGGVAPPKVKVK
jgi:hypothetical protein